MLGYIRIGEMRDMGFPSLQNMYYTLRNRALTKRYRRILGFNQQTIGFGRCLSSEPSWKYLNNIVSKYLSLRFFAFLNNIIFKTIG